MANQQNLILKLEAQVKGQLEVAELKGRVAKLTEAFLANGPASKQSAAALQAHAAAVAPLQQRIDELTSSMRRMNTGSSGRGLLEVSRGLEDLQYGVNGVLNNLPTMIEAMGGGAGLAGIASIAAVSVYQLWKNWDLLSQSMQGHTPFQTLSSQIDVLNAKVHKTIDDIIRLQKLQQGQKAVDAAAEGVPAGDAAKLKAINEAAANAGGPQFLKRLEETGFSGGMVGKDTIDAANKRVADAQARIKAASQITDAKTGESRSSDPGAQAELDAAKADRQRITQYAYGRAIANGKGDTITQHMQANPQAFTAKEVENFKAAVNAIDKAELDAAKVTVQGWIKRGVDEMKYWRDSQDAQRKAAKDAEAARKKAQEEAKKAVKKWINDKVIDPIKDWSKQATFDLHEKEKKQQADQQGQRQQADWITAESNKDIQRRPGLDDRIKTELGMREVEGQSPEQAAKAMESRLAKQLMDLSGGKLFVPDAMKMARERLEAAQGDLDKDVYDRAMTPEKATKVEVSGIRDFVDKIQTGFGKGTDEKQLKVQEQIRDILASRPDVVSKLVWQ